MVLIDLNHFSLVALWNSLSHQYVHHTLTHYSLACTNMQAWTDQEMICGLGRLRLSYCGCTHDGEVDNVTEQCTSYTHQLSF